MNFSSKLQQLLQQVTANGDKPDTARSTLSEGKESDLLGMSDTSDLESSTPGLTTSGSVFTDIPPMKKGETSLQPQPPVKGERVSVTQTQWEGKYYGGTVDVVNADGTYGIAFDDNDYIGDVRQDELKRFQVRFHLFFYFVANQKSI